MAIIEAFVFTLELPVTLLIMFIFLVLMITVVLWIPVDCAIRYLKPAKEPPQVLQTSPVECQNAVETPKQRVERKVIAQRKKRHRFCNDDEARSARVQEMTNAIERSHKRLREGRERAFQLRRVFSRMNNKAILKMAKTKEDSKRVFSELEELRREKDTEFREWVRSITNSSRQISEKFREISDARSSPGNKDVGRSKENEGESSSRAAGLKENPGKECSTSKNEQNKENKETSVDNNNEKEKKHQTSRPLGDTKTIKMKFGKNNKLACLMEKSFSGDGFYVYL